MKEKRRWTIGEFFITDLHNCIADYFNSIYGIHSLAAETPEE
jgi:hypothetical protein